MKFKQWLETWDQATANDYNVLAIMADYVEERPYELASWFHQLKNAAIDFLKRVEALQTQLDSGDWWMDEPEEDPLDSMHDWIELHLLNAIHRVLDGGITHNGPLFSVGNAIKNTYENLLPFLEYTNYYTVNDAPDDQQRVVHDINNQTYQLIRSYIQFMKWVYPFFLRMANLRFKPVTNKTKKSTFEKLSSLPGFRNDDNV